MRYTLIFYTTIIGFFSQITYISGSDIPNTPFLKNYSKRDYNARTQNWDVVQNENNIMYFANNEGVLQFDGVNWDKIEMPNKSIVRSLYCLSGDTLFAGAYSEFGMIFHDKKGELVYESWNTKIPKEYTNYGEIWRIHKIGERVIIQSFSHLILFENGQFVKAIVPENGFMFSFLNNGILYIQEPKTGLFKLVNNDLELASNIDVFKNFEVWAFMPFDENCMLVGTQFNGFYLFDGAQTTPWDNEANDFIIRNNLFSAIPMTNGNFVFGSIQNGLIIVNRSGKIISLENTDVGLQNNTVLSLFEDNAQNLWLGLDNGIDYVKTNSPLSYVRKKGGFGTGYTSLIHNDKLYAGTNQGLFFMPLNATNEKFGVNTDFEIVESTRGQVWCLKSIDDKLFCGHNTGMYLINENKATKIGNINGVWDVAEIPNDSLHLLIGTYQGFYVLNKHNYDLIKLKGFDESARRILFYKGNRLLLNHGYKGIFDIRIDVENNLAEVLHFYDGSKYLPNKVGNDVFRFNNEIVVTTDSGVYNYQNNQFTYSQFWNDLFEGNPNRISNIIDGGNSKFWCFKEGQASLLTYLNEKMFELNTRDFLSIYNTFPTSFENVLKVNDSDYLIGNEDGFVLYEDKGDNKNKEKISVDVSSMQFKYKGENSYNRLEFNKNAGKVELSKLDYKQHRLKIILAFPFYVNQNLVQYRYRLNNGPWLEWASGNELKLDDLREGNYVIDVQCSIDKKNISGDLAINFTIDPPFFRRWYSYVIYLLLFFTGTLMSSKLIKKRIENEKRREALKQQRKMIEKQIKFEREAELAQSELINLRNERLKTDIRHKSKELANTTMSLINKNKILQQFKDVLGDIKKEDVRYRENSKINSLIKKINKEIEHQDNWMVFEENFDKVHENFLQRIKGKHPDLTPKDLRLAAYLRMNLSSKEIAPLLNISIRSVEISRYRLRKKMDLNHDENLTEYLIST